MIPQSRYHSNPKFDNRKEKDGFICAPGTTKYCTHCVAVKVGDDVQIRDTKDDKDTTLSFTRPEWTAFIAAVKDGLYDV